MIKEISIKSNRENYEIPCIYNFPSKMKKIIIAIHGFGSTKRSETITDLMKILDKYNIGVIALDLPSHGDSIQEGEYLTVENCISDINSVENYIITKYTNMDIGFFASSFGAYLTLLKINRSEKLYNTVVLRCPAISMAKIFEGLLASENTTIEEFKEKGYVREGFARRFDVTYSMYEDLVQNDVLRDYNSKNNILIIHGLKDDVAPISDSIKLTQKHSNYIKLEKIEGANHRFEEEGKREKVLEIARDYIINT